MELENFKEQIKKDSLRTLFHRYTEVVRDTGMVALTRRQYGEAILREAEFRCTNDK